MPRIKVQDMVSSQSFVGNTTAQYITAATPIAIGLTGDFTVGAWVKLAPKNVAGNNDSHCIGTFNFNYAANQGYNFGVRASDGSLNLFGGSASSATSAGIVPYNVWAFLVIEMVGTSANIYVNDMVTPRTTITVTRKADSTLFTRFAAEGFSTGATERRIRGNIKTIFATNSVLTADQKYAIMNGTGVPPVSLLYKLDENTGTTATDSSGNGNNGTITNGTWSTDTPSKLRTAATNRVAVQDVKSSLNAGSTGHINSATPYATPASGSTIMFWCKLNSYTNSGCLFNNVVAGNLALVISQPGLLGCLTAGYYNGSSYVGVCTTNPVVRYGKWMHVAFTLTGTTGLLYINATLDNQGAANPTSALSPVGMSINARADNSYPSKAQYSNVYFYDSVLTQAQIVSAMNGVYPLGAHRIWKLQEGAGTTAYDTSGNGNHGTITGGTYTSDVPTKKRGVVGGNMVYNGDFEYAPPFTAATNTQFSWIDGKASGNQNPSNIFGWGVSVIVGTVSAKYDNGSLKLSTLATGSALYTPQKANIAFKNTTIPVIPNTSYTLSCRIKTTLISGSATTGAKLYAAQLAADDVTSTGYTTLVTGIVTTTDWTTYTLTFTTAGNTRFINITPQIVGNDGAATLIMDAWFSNIEFRPTTVATRTAV